MDIDEQKKNRETLKGYFKKNAIPTQAQFEQLIDSILNQREDGLVKPQNDPLSIEAVGGGTTFNKVLNFYVEFADPQPAWTIALRPRTDPDDPNTGTLGFSIGDGAGNSRLSIDAATGNVGIGTVTPAEKLTVNGAISGFGVVPVGAIVAWHKSATGVPALPAGWAECNGQTINDPNSVFNGRAVPDLNSAGLFLRGGATSGTQQSHAIASHGHAVNIASQSVGDHDHVGSTTVAATNLGSHDHGVTVSVNTTGSHGHSFRVGPGGTDDDGFIGSTSFSINTGTNIDRFFSGITASGNHTHTVSVDVLPANLGSHLHTATTQVASAGAHAHTVSGSTAVTGTTETRPSNMSVVWIIRIK